jgi:hypothetical protein
MSTQTAGLPTIDMRSISQLAEGDEMGDEFVAEIIDVFLADLSERVRTIGLQMRTIAPELRQPRMQSKAAAVILARRA